MESMQSVSVDRKQDKKKVGPKVEVDETTMDSEDATQNSAQ